MNKENIKIILLHGLLGSKNIFEFFKKEFCDCYDMVAIDLIGFGDEAKPHINYDVDDFIKFIEDKINLSKDDNTKYIIIGYSLGALLAKKLAIKYPSKAIKVFLIGYPWKEKSEAYQERSALDRAYVEGRWWARLICDSKDVYKWFLYPFVFLFANKYHKAFMDTFKHTYISASRTIHNAILKDNKEELFRISNKVFLINGEKDKNADFVFAKQFNNRIVTRMGHNFLKYENKIAEIIKSDIEEVCSCLPSPRFPSS
jgi:pimeloyl-ACP methyl ester carboxylesterase